MGVGVGVGASVTVLVPAGVAVTAEASPAREALGGVIPGDSKSLIRGINSIPAKRKITSAAPAAIVIQAH